MTREEAIEVYNGLVNTKIKEAFEFFAPELRDSEDERVRKVLVDMVKRETGFTGFPSQGQVLAYLEKQKEQKPVQSDVEKEYVRILKSIVSDFIRDKKPKDTLLYQDIFDWLEGRHIEQKPTEWSEEDKMNLNGCICSLHQYGYMTYADFLRHLPERFNLQPKQEWSEEDEKLLDFWLDVIDRNDWRMDENFCKASREFINRLKSLRPSWKPSEEQMEALKEASASWMNARMGNAKLLKSLYEQLKKL